MSNEKKPHHSELNASDPSLLIPPESSVVTSRQASPQIIELIAKHKVEGLRLDQYLASMFSDHSRSVIQKVIEADGVQVNGKPGKASYRIRYGDQVRITLPPPTHDLPVPEDIPLDVLYEDEFLALVNKPADMVVHPAKGHWSGTLVNALQFRFAELSQAGGEYRPGIVHRLDRDTSGVILIAKEELTHRDLSMQFESRKIFKEYQAITAGVLDRDSDYIERRITKHSRDRVKMMVTDEEEDSKEACSYYEVIERFRGFSFCRIQPRTGRTHQIRVHLASIGCPVLADKAYGGRDNLRLSDIAPEINPAADDILLTRQALHASRLRFQHPRTGRVIQVEAPLPPDFEKTLTALRQYRPLTGAKR
jgi:23S rRNA pseudouridine1911/1915/1917 synthase